MHTVYEWNNWKKIISISIGKGQNGYLWTRHKLRPTSEAFIWSHSATVCYSRASKMLHLRQQVNKIVKSLMADNEYVDELKANKVKFTDILNEFKALYKSYIQMRNEVDKRENLRSWYKPRVAQINTFLSNVNEWISAIKKYCSSHCSYHSCVLFWNECKCLPKWWW